jgi:hypothetical protein
VERAFEDGSCDANAMGRRLVNCEGHSRGWRVADLAVKGERHFSLFACVRREHVLTWMPGELYAASAHPLIEPIEPT